MLRGTFRLVGVIGGLGRVVKGVERVVRGLRRVVKCLRWLVNFDVEAFLEEPELLEVAR